MLKPRFLAVILVLVLTILACGTQSGAVTSVPGGGAPRPTSVPVVPIATPTEETPSCKGESWEIIPTNVYQFDPGGGWKNLIVTLVFHNGSPYWGGLSIPLWGGLANPYTPQISTEGGFVYDLYQGDFYIPDANLEGTPYPGYTFGVTNLTSLGIWFPPGFYAHGTGSIESLSVDNRPLTLLFQVPTTQQHFVVTLPEVSIDCRLPDGQVVYQTIKDVKLNLDTDVRTTTSLTSGASSNLRSITGTTFEIPDYVTIESLGVRWLDWQGLSTTYHVLVFDFEVKNASSGYQTKGDLSGTTYLIEDGGFIRFDEGCGCEYSLDLPGGYFNLGPDQSTKVSIAYIANPDSHYKLVWIDGDHGIYEVFNIP